MTILKKSVSLNPGESKTVGFTFTPTIAKAYNVLVNGLTGSFTATILAGNIGPGFIWYEGLAGWEWTIPGREIALNEEIHLAPSWLNESEINIIGHVDLSVTYPDGVELTLSATQNQDMEATPRNGYSVQFAPFISSQEGTYTVKATLSSDGQVLDSVTFTLITVPVEIIWVLPTSYIDPGNGWNNEELAYDGLTDTYTESKSVSPKSWSQPLEFTITPTEISAVRIWQRFRSSHTAIVEVLYDGTWHSIYEGFLYGYEWTEISILGGTQIISKARITYYNPTRSVPYTFRISEFEFGKS